MAIALAAVVALVAASVFAVLALMRTLDDGHRELMFAAAERFEQRLLGTSLSNRTRDGRGYLLSGNREFLATRASARAEFDRYLAALATERAEYPRALAIIDLDRFKSIACSAERAATPAERSRAVSPVKHWRLLCERPCAGGTPSADRKYAIFTLGNTPNA